VIKVGVSKENVRVTHGNPDLIVYFNGNAIAS
jgi:hypothetical protein